MGTAVHCRLPACNKCGLCASGEYIGKAVDDSVGLVVPNTVNFFNGKMIVTDATLGTTAGRVLSFDVPQSAYLGTLTVSHPFIQHMLYSHMPVVRTSCIHGAHQASQ